MPLKKSTEAIYFIQLLTESSVVNAFFLWTNQWNIHNMNKFTCIPNFPVYFRIFSCDQNSLSIFKTISTSCKESRVSIAPTSSFVIGDLNLIAQLHCGNDVIHASNVVMYCVQIMVRDICLLTSTKFPVNCHIWCPINAKLSCNIWLNHV